MNSIQLVNGLHPYLLLLNSLEVQELAHYNGSEEYKTGFAKSVSLKYNSITLGLNAKKEYRFTSNYFIGTLEINDQAVSIRNLYCEAKSREESIKDYILLHIPKVFQTEGTPKFYSDTTLQYLSIADEIANEAYLRSKGDDYRPGYYSEIIIETDKIILKQVNHWNARSIDHKNDYHLRDLVFFIPLNEDVIMPSRFNEQKIGSMRIDFSDSSSANNKSCGDAIQVKIDEEILKFER